MDVLSYLVPTAVCMGVLGVVAFFWTLQNKQYDDLDGSANRVLFDDEDDVVVIEDSNNKKKSKQL